MQNYELQAEVQQITGTDKKTGYFRSQKLVVQEVL